MTVYDKIMNTPLLLVEFIVDAYECDEDLEQESCSFCIYNTLICDKVDGHCSEGYISYYHEHPELFSKDLIDVETLANLIYKGHYKRDFLPDLDLKKKHQNLKDKELCVKSLIEILNSSYEGEVEQLIDNLLDEAENYFG